MQERDAARNFAACSEQLELDRGTLTQLQSHRESYSSKFNHAASKGFNASHLCAFKGFQSKLDEAVNVQQQKITQCKKQLEELRQVWVRLRSKDKAYDKLHDRYSREETFQKERLLQKENDEVCTQLNRRASNSPDSA